MCMCVFNHFITFFYIIRTNNYKEEKKSKKKYQRQKEMMTITQRERESLENKSIAFYNMKIYSNIFNSCSLSFFFQIFWEREREKDN